MTLIANDPDELYSAPVERLGRYVLHRAGIFNVWQYDDVELHFHGGRMLLRGKNGAGKSKAMEMLLPFLLDGDTRNLDCVKRDRTTLTWLMTAGREAGNHIGYIWLELRCVEADGSETFRTLGCGVKASTSTGRPKLWFFVTRKRVGDDLIIRDGANPIGQEQFKEQLDADDYFTSATSYATRVAKELFGIEDLHRYRNLCHLLYELRRPSVGESIEEGNHVAVLSSALPPLDDELVADVARNFDDLDKIRKDLADGEQTERAVAGFLAEYAAYTRGVIQTGAAGVVEAGAAADREHRDLRKAAEKVEETETLADDAGGTVDDLDAQARNSKDEIDILQKQPAYAEAQRLDDRRARVATAKEHAEAAKGRSVEVRAGTERDAGRVTSTAQELLAAVAKLDRARTELEGDAAGAGVDPVLFGDHLDVPVTGSAGDAEAPLRIGDTAGAQLDSYDIALTAVARASEVRRRVVDQLVGDARKADELRGEADALAEKVEGALRRLEAAERDVEQATEAAVRADRAWRAQLTEWLGGPTQQKVTTDWADVASYTAFDDDDGDEGPALLDAGDFDDVDQLVDAVFGPARRDALEAQAGAVATLRSAEIAVADLVEQYRQVEARAEKLPEPGRHRTGDRDPATGTPFYALVDFVDDVDPTTAAAVEAALEAAGLLDGLVAADGTVSIDGDTVLVADGSAGPQTTLASVLTVAPPPDSPVSAEAVAGLLDSIAYGATETAATWVDASGRWRLGVAHGQWSKPQVTYIGVGARQAARERELAALAEQLVGARAEVDAAELLLDDVKRWVADLDAARRLPPATAVQQAVSQVAAHRGVAATARAEHQALVGPAAQAQDIAARAERELQAAAAGHGLPHDVGSLARLVGQLRSLGQRVENQRDLVGNARQIMGRHAAAHSEHAATSEQLDTAVREARRVRDEYESEAGQLATLEDTFGDDAREVMAKIADAEEELRESERQLPRARREAEDARVAHAMAVKDHEDHAQSVRRADGRVGSTADVLARILNIPGVALAAFGDRMPPLAYPSAPEGEEPAARVRRLRTWAGKVNEAAAGKIVSASVILKRFEELGPGLAVGYDAHQDETPDGVKIFELRDDTGAHPIAVVAQRLTADVAAARGRLTDRQAQIFERFLHGELGDHLRRQLLDADTLVQAMNKALDGVRTSHGLGAKLEWHLKEGAPAEAVEAIPLLRDGFRDTERNERLATLLGALIDSARIANPTEGYEAHLRNALDYRGWHEFTIKVLEDANPGKERKLSSRLAVSQGEQRVLVYLALFSAAAAYFNSLERRAPHAPRVILLDDAFAKIDEPTHGPLLRLLVDLNLDFIITSERVTGCQPGIPSLEIYECLRDPKVRGVALVHTTWDGQRATLAAV